MEGDYGVVFQVGSDVSYRGEEIILKRKGREEKLVRWVSIQEEPQIDGNGHKDLLMWMNDQEIASCCPHLFGTKVCEAPEPFIMDTGTGLVTAGMQEGVASSDEEDSFREMAGDVYDLVARAKRINLNLKEKPHPSNEKLLSNTLNILSAYAKFGSLANSFRQCGVLELLLDLLSSPVAADANDMLRSLALYDSTSRSYVLFQLTQSTKEATAENRQVLLDLFDDTTLDEEREEASDILLPQVLLLPLDQTDQYNKPVYH